MCIFSYSDLSFKGYNICIYLKQITQIIDHILVVSDKIHIRAVSASRLKLSVLL